MDINVERLSLEIKNIAKTRNLLLVILYGSRAAGAALPESDIDIAVLGKEPISFEKLIELTNEFTDILNCNKIDLKSLHNTDPLFRYQVMKKGILLYGNRLDYLSFKAYAFRDYYDSQDLLRLKEAIIKKRLQTLKI